MIGMRRQERKENQKKHKFIPFDSNVDFLLWLFQFHLCTKKMLNGESNDPQLSNTYLDNIIKQLEISDGSQATSSVR